MTLASDSQTIPRRYRGRAGYTRMLRDVPLRISVSGIRGKTGLTLLAEEELRARGRSTYAKVTGTDPFSIRNGRRFPIAREGHANVLEESMREIAKHWGDGIDALILENQAITLYTMTVFNRLFCRPHYLLITNVRRDHTGDIARTLPALARAFGRSAFPGSSVISAETDDVLNDIMRREAKRQHARFSVVPVGADEPPGFGSVLLLDALLRDATGTDVRPDRISQERARLQSKFAWGPSALPGVMWFHGAEINDMDSTRAVHRYLQLVRPLPTSFIAYFRRNRVDRTESFMQFLRAGFEEGWCRRVFLAGHAASVVARRLRRLSADVHVFRDDVAEVPRLIDLVSRTCEGEAVMTVGNAVPPFARAVAAALDPVPVALDPVPAPRKGVHP